MEEEEIEEIRRLREQLPVSFKRWIAREIESGKISIKEAIERFGVNGRTIYEWLSHYSLGKEVSLSIMTPQEKQEKILLEKRIKELEKALEYAKLKNIAVETMIDVAEEQFRISIRKKAGPKQ
ncbi:MAG TPA: transposase [Bacteroidales bacterium]|nr:transposase [Bacteroidales bacterium]